MILLSATSSTNDSRGRGSPRKRALFAMAAAAIAGAATLGFAEIAIRLFVPRPYWVFHDSKRDWTPDDELGWIQRKNHRVETIRDDGVAIVFATNSDGVRPESARREKSAGRARLLVFGDSTAVGRSVPYAAGITANLDAEFRRRGLAVEAINAGVEGYATDQAVLLAERLLPLYRPDVVLLCVCSNDHGGNCRSREYGIGKPRFERTANGGLQPVPFEKSDAIGWFGSGPRQWAQSSALYRFLQPSLIRLRGKLSDADLDARLGFSPWYYVRSRPDLARIDWELFGRLLSRMNAAARAVGAEFAFYSHPALEEIWEPYIAGVCASEGISPDDYDRGALDANYRTVATRLGLRYLPTIDAFRGKESEGPFHLLPRDPHCNEVGYRLTAAALANALLADAATLQRLSASSAMNAAVPREGNRPHDGR